jgi:uncharacterized protein YjlB
MTQAAAKHPDRNEPVTLLLADDGLVPNNPRLPLVLYHGAIALSGHADPAARFEREFARNGWGDAWRNGIYDFVHFHSMIHEVLGIAAGHARVRFGGKLGRELDLVAGDVAVLPAGTGHQRISASPDLLVVGAYPPEGTFDLCRPTLAEHARARETIPFVPLPKYDPLFGEQGPLIRLWGS